MTQRLSGKTALITGGSSGIGLATARLILEHGAQVAITGRDAATLDEASNTLGQNMAAISSDTGRLTDIEQLVATLKARWQHLDVLFINAAIAGPAPFDAVSEARFDELTAVNFKGAFFTVQKALPLLSNKASVILTTSIVNQMGSPNFSVYGAWFEQRR